jgi:RNA polymerase sigma-70 factor (ECF subfamily)
MPPLDRDSPDGILIAAALDGDQHAFAHLIRRYQPALFRLAISRLGQRELAEEAVQETFLAAHRWLSTYDSRYSFRTWLWSILLSQCIRQAKREARQPSESLADPNTAAAAADPTPLGKLLESESRDRLYELLARLPMPQADALRLRFFAGLTFPEIAAAMQISEAGAKHRVKTALIKLGQWLGNTQPAAYRLASDEDCAAPGGSAAAATRPSDRSNEP